MKRKLGSLILLVIFVFMSLPTFGAFANDGVLIKALINENIETNDTNGYVTNTNPETSERDTIIPFNNRDYYVFEITIPESGTYTVGMRCGVHNTYPVKTQVSILNGSDYETLFETQLEGTGGYTRVSDQDIGEVELTAGTYKFKFLNTYSDAYLAAVTFALVEAEDSEEDYGPITFSAMDKTDGNIRVGGGYGVFAASNWASYSVDVPQDGYYKVTLKYLPLPQDTSNLGATAITLAVDDEDGKEFGMRTVSSARTRNVGYVYMEKGSHLLKMTASGERGYRVSDVTVEKAEPHNISAGEVRIPAVSYIAANPQSESTGGATSGITNDDGFLEWHPSQEVYYLLEVTKAGSYDFWTVTGNTTVTSANLYIGEQSGRASAESSGGYYCGIASSKVTFELSEGVHILKARQNSSAYYFGLYAQRSGSSLVTDVLENEEAIIEAEDFNKSTGDLTDDGVLFTDGDTAEYKVRVEKSGEYEITVSYKNETSDSALLDLKNGNEIIGSAELESQNSFAEKTIKDIMFEEGSFTLTLKASDSDAEIDYIKIKRVGGIIPKLYDEITFEAEDYYESQGATVLKDGEKDVLVFAPSADASYRFNATENALYQIKLNAKNTKSGTLKLLIDDEIVYVKTLGSKSVAFDNYIICNLNIEEGKHTLKLLSDDFTGAIDNINIKKYVLSNQDSSTTYLSVRDREATSDGLKVWANDKSSNPEWPVVGLAELNGSGWVEFSYTAEKDGLYELISIVGSNGGIAADILVDGVTVLAGVKPKNTGSFYFADATTLGTFELTSGEHIIRYKGTSGAAWLFGLNIKPAYAYVELDAVYTDDIVIANGTEIPKGTSKIDVKFTSNVKETGDITLECEDGSVIPVEIKTDKNIVSLLLKKALDADKAYTINVSGTKNVYDGVLEGGESVSFVPGGKDGAKDTLELLSYGLNDENVAEFSYVVKTESGIGIKGRAFKLSVKTPSGELLDVPAYEGKTEEDGVVNTSYSFTQSHESGKYEFVATSEYTENAPVSCYVSFITDAREVELLDTLGTTTETDVKDFFEDYEGELGINLEKDLENISNADKFYEKFAGASYENYEELMAAYNETIIVEEINQATGTEIIEEMLTDDFFFESVDVPKEKVEIVLKNTANLLAQRIYDLEEVADNDELIAKVNELIEDELLKVGKREDITLKDSEITIKEGNSIKLPLDFEKKAEEVLEVVLKVSSSDTDFAEEYTSVNTSKDAEYEVKYENDAIIVKYTFEKPVALSSLGSVSVFPEDSKSSYDVKVSGDVAYKVYLDTAYGVEESMILNGKITEKTFEVDVVANSRPQGGGSSSGSSDRVVSSGSSRGSSAGANVVIPEVVKPEEKFEFVDIENVSWAQESINALLELGVISESEDKCFNPENNITREQFVKLIVEALELTDESAKTSLSDVEENAWYYKYVASAEKYGIVTGSDGKFGIGENITRQDMSVIIKRAMELTEVRFPKYTGKAFKDDAEIAEYAKDAVYSLKSMNIINGTGENNFTPKGNATRAQAAKMIYEMLKVVSA